METILSHLKNILLACVKIIIVFITSMIILGYGYTYYKESISNLTTPDAIKKVNIENGDITYLSYGEPKNQPILLIHGTGANAFIWEKTSTFLASQGYYVVAIDVPPFGWSSIPLSPQDYRKETQAKKVITLLEKLSIKNPIIVGHSYNSKVALLVASQYPARELVMIAPVLQYGEKEEAGIAGILTSISIIRDPFLSLFVNNTLLAKKVLLSFMYIQDTDITDTLKMTVLPFNKPGVNHAYGEWFQEFFNEASTVPDSDTLTNLKIPAHIIWGDHDTISPIENFTKLQALSPKATLSSLPNVGHMPHLENTELFNAALQKILKK